MDDDNNITLRKIFDGNEDTIALIVTENGPTYTRKQLHDEILCACRQLAQLGIMRGNVVSLCFKNNTEFVICFLALTFLGAIAAPLNEKYNREEVEFYLEDILSSLLLIPSTGNIQAEQAANKLKVSVATVSMDHKNGITISSKTNCSTTLQNDAVALTEPLPSDVALFLHTSGTTGRSKGVPLSHRNMITAMKNILLCYKLSSQDRGYVVMPLFHIHGLISGLLAPLFSSGSIVIPANGVGFQANSLWRHVNEHKCTWFTAVPTMHQALLAASITYEAADRPTLRFIRSCSSSLPPAILSQLELTFNSPVIEAYAMTEACHQVTSNPLPEDGPHKAGSVGKPFSVELKIICISNHEFAEITQPGQIGEVCVYGSNVTQGYHNRPDANRESFLSDGFFRTGDLGYFDADGYLYLTGRIKEQINRGGEKIAPVSIDNALLECPGIATLFSFGVPHRELGETVGVVVVEKTLCSVSLKALNTFGLKSGHLPIQWLPTVIVYCDKVPLGPTGKVQRTKLASMLELPELSAAIGPTSFQWNPAEGLQKLDDKAGVNPVSSSGDVTLEILTSLVSDVLGMDLTGIVELQLDSFTAVSLKNALLSKLQITVLPKDCMSLSINRLYNVYCRSQLKTPEQLSVVIGDILGIDLTDNIGMQFSLDSFSAVNLCAILKSKYYVELDQKEILRGASSVETLHNLIVNATQLGNPDSNLTPAPEPRSADDFELEALLTPEVRNALQAAATVVSNSSVSLGSSILLTGATGFLGSHILYSLLQYPNVSQVFCVVRESTIDGAKRRVLERLNQQGLSCPAEKIIALCGDTSLPNWGLSAEDIAMFGDSKLRAILHNSAYVNHALQYRSLHPHNVGSVLTAISLSCAVMIASGAPCHVSFVSTCGVCVRMSFHSALEPTRCPAAELKRQIGYVQCKWVAERIIENAAQFLSTRIAADKQNGPNFTIFRPGTVTGHSVTGVSNVSDSINRYIIGWCLLETAPPLDPHAQVDTSPVDWTSAAIAGILLQHCHLVPYPSQLNLMTPSKIVLTYTLDNGFSLKYSELIGLLGSLGRPIKISSTYEQWVALLIQSLELEDLSANSVETSSGGSRVIKHPNPLRSLRGALTARQPKFGSTHCLKHMKLLADHGFPSPVIDQLYISVMLSYFASVQAIP